MAKHFIILNMSTCGTHSFSLPNSVMWLTLKGDRPTGLLDFALLGICAAMIWYQWGLQDYFHYQRSQIKPGLLLSSHPSSGTEQSIHPSPPKDHYQTLLQFVPGCAQIMEINNAPGKTFSWEMGPSCLKSLGSVQRKYQRKGKSSILSQVFFLFLNPNTLPCPMPHIQT